MDSDARATTTRVVIRHRKPSRTPSGSVSPRTRASASQPPRVRTSKRSASSVARDLRKPLPHAGHPRRLAAVQADHGDAVRPERSNESGMAAGVFDMRDRERDVLGSADRRREDGDAPGRETLASPSLHSPSVVAAPGRETLAATTVGIEAVQKRKAGEAAASTVGTTTLADAGRETLVGGVTPTVGAAPADEDTVVKRPRPITPRGDRNKQVPRDNAQVPPNTHGERSADYGARGSKSVPREIAGQAAGSIDRTSPAAPAAPSAGPAADLVALLGRTTPKSVRKN